MCQDAAVQARWSLVRISKKVSVRLFDRKGFIVQSSDNCVRSDLSFADGNFMLAICEDPMNPESYVLY